jgi:hypothetical protein
MCLVSKFLYFHFIYAEVRSLSILLEFVSSPIATMTGLHKFLALEIRDEQILYNGSFYLRILIKQLVSFKTFGAIILWCFLGFRKMCAPEFYEKILIFLIMCETISKQSRN